MEGLQPQIVDEITSMSLREPHFIYHARWFQVEGSLHGNDSVDVEVEDGGDSDDEVERDGDIDVDGSGGQVTNPLVSKPDVDPEKCSR